jgi:NitT/TauT family transport system substrate-binding protein
VAQEIRIEFTRFSAFYSPLIATIAGGFLKKEGLEARHAVSAPGRTAIASLLEGSAHVVQSAPSQGFAPLEQGKTPPALHFAQINERDGFFLAGRAPDRAFSWDRLRGKRVLVDHGMQPLAMFKYACHKRGLEFGAITAVDAGPTDQMIAAFRGARATSSTSRGPRPRSSSTTAPATSWPRSATQSAPVPSRASPRRGSGSPPTWPSASWRPTGGARLADRDAGGRGGSGRGLSLPRRALRGLDDHDRHLPAARQLDPHVEITRPAWEATVDIFLHAGLITRRHGYEDVIASPP